MSKRAMLINYKYCTGCHSCEVSCRKEKGLSLDEWGIKVNEVGPAKFSDGKWEWDYIPAPSRLCDLCEERIEEGKIPLCELHCLAAVIKVVPAEEATKLISENTEGKIAIYIP
ncbi:oxidoreductase [Ellagibacter isourolithinifaciens]|uniref:oxidoreductase n=1 Tax=Ellagibacter isourolithinifaciens TaxID=2137581 RepID=UPI003A8EACF7